MNESSPSAAYRAIANTYVVEISVDLEPDFAAVAIAAVHLFHDV
jgi:hypothetical protein